MSHVDFGEVFRAEPDYRKYYDGIAVHFGVVGNEKIARVLVEFISGLERQSSWQRGPTGGI